MAIRIFLALSAALWLPYGLYCFVNPAYLAEAAGVAAGTATGTIELRAMYGGLQTAIGALALLAIWRGALRPSALLCIAFLCSGLALARLLGAAIDSDLSSYTAMGLGFEIVSAGVAITFLRGSDAAVAA